MTAIPELRLVYRIVRPSEQHENGSDRREDRGDHDDPEGESACAAFVSGVTDSSGGARRVLLDDNAVALTVDGDADGLLGNLACRQRLARWWAARISAMRATSLVRTASRIRVSGTRLTSQ